jgi:L-lysine exporter family protein LysE/ArgO
VYLFIGFVIGFIAAIPLGPVNIFVISQTMKRGFIHGFIGGLTACVLDTVYCLVAILGLSRITSEYVRYGPALKAPAALFLALIAGRLLYQAKRGLIGRKTETLAKFSPKPMIGVVLMYISNPSLYAFWIAVAGMATSHEWVHRVGMTPFLFAILCGIGGSAWYLILTHYVAKHHHQFSPRTFRAIIAGLAIVLFAFAGYTFASIFIKF